MNTRKTKPKAFTLIELLVVIAIIALLLSIVMPALRLVKEKGKNLSCRANIRSLATAFRLYTETNDGRVFGYGTSTGNNLWLTQIEDQLGEIDKVRYCSSTKINESTSSDWGSANETWVWTGGVVEPERGSYGINGFIYSSTPSWIVPANEWEASKWGNSNVSSNSASVPMFIDSVWVDLWPQDNDFVPDNHSLDIGGSGGNGAGRNMMLRCMIDRHGGNLSVSFLDGHVEPIALRMMWSLKWNREFITRPEQLRQNGTPIYQQ